MRTCVLTHLRGHEKMSNYSTVWRRSVDLKRQLHEATLWQTRISKLLVLV